VLDTKTNSVVDPTLGWQPKSMYLGVVIGGVRDTKSARSKSDDLMAINEDSIPWLKEKTH
jgi:hypothetical protein